MKLPSASYQGVGSKVFNDFFRRNRPLRRYNTDRVQIQSTGMHIQAQITHPGKKGAFFNPTQIDPKPPPDPA